MVILLRYSVARRFLRTLRQLEEADKFLPSWLRDVQYGRGVVERELAQMAQEWALGGDDYRLLQFAENNLRDDPQTRERLFDAFAKGSDVKRTALGNRFNRQATDSTISAAKPREPWKQTGASSPRRPIEDVKPEQADRGKNGNSDRKSVV